MNNDTQYIISKREETESRLFDVIAKKYNISLQYQSYLYSLFRLVFAWMRVEYPHLPPNTFRHMTIVLYLKLMNNWLKKQSKKEVGVAAADPTFGNAKNELSSLEKIINKDEMDKYKTKTMESWKFSQLEVIDHIHMNLKRLDFTLEEINDIFLPIREIRTLHDLPIEHHTIFIDSRMRNMTKYPDQHNYTIHLEQVLKNVVQIELISSAFPITQYTVDSTNNTFYFAESVSQILENGVMYEAIIEDGVYSEATLATAVANAMNSVPSASSTYSTSTTTIEPTTKLTITSDGLGGDGLFYLRFQNYDDDSAHDILGFAPNTTSSGSLSYIGDEGMNVESSKNLFININDFKTIHADVEFFGHIPLEASFGSYSYWTRDNGIAILYIPQRDRIIPSMDRFDISIRNAFGELYDFNGVDHYMVFKITTLTVNSL